MIFVFKFKQSNLPSRKNLVKETIINEISTCMQEAQINFNFDHSLLSFPGYYIATEKNSGIARTAIYISNRIEYQRRVDLEGEDSNIIIFMNSNVIKII